MYDFDNDNRGMKRCSIFEHTVERSNADKNKKIFGLQDVFSVENRSSFRSDSKRRFTINCDSLFYKEKIKHVDKKLIYGIRRSLDYHILKNALNLVSKEKVCIWSDEKINMHKVDISNIESNYDLINNKKSFDLTSTNPKDNQRISINDNFGFTSVINCKRTPIIERSRSESSIFEYFSNDRIPKEKILSLIQTPVDNISQSLETSRMQFKTPLNETVKKNIELKSFSPKSIKRTCSENSKLIFGLTNDSVALVEAICKQYDFNGNSIIALPLIYSSLFTNSINYCSILQLACKISSYSVVKTLLLITSSKIDNGQDVFNLLLGMFKPLPYELEKKFYSRNVSFSESSNLINRDSVLLTEPTSIYSSNYSPSSFSSSLDTPKLYNTKKEKLSRCYLLDSLHRSSNYNSFNRAKIVEILCNSYFNIDQNLKNAELIAQNARIWLEEAEDDLLDYSNSKENRQSAKSVRLACYIFLLYYDFVKVKQAFSMDTSLQLNTIYFTDKFNFDTIFLVQTNHQKFETFYKQSSASYITKINENKSVDDLILENFILIDRKSTKSKQKQNYIMMHQILGYLGLRFTLKNSI